jgi:hypothetical protein
MKRETLKYKMKNKDYITPCPIYENHPIGGLSCEFCPRFVTIDRMNQEVTHNID